MIDARHPDSAMRGKHLIDINTGQVWPWTSALSKKEHMRLYDEKKPSDKAFREDLTNKKNKIELVIEEPPGDEK